MVQSYTDDILGVLNSSAAFNQRPPCSRLQFYRADTYVSDILWSLCAIADAELTFDIDQIGSLVAGAGCKVALIGTRP